MLSALIQAQAACEEAGSLLETHDEPDAEHFRQKLIELETQMRAVWEDIECGFGSSSG